MKKQLLKSLLLSVLMILGGGTSVWADEEISATVKMTYVDYDNPDTSYGEIGNGELAQSGYNKISGGAVGFVNTGWGCNWITYLQVDASEVPEGMSIIKATLTFEGSGSTDSKRTTGWRVGYNSSEWSSDLTYNSADKSIIELDAEKWTATKSATTFESFTFDITAALKEAENNVATILVCETAAAGGYIKNPTVTVVYSEQRVYQVTFKETNDARLHIVKMDGKDVKDGVLLLNGTYEFTALAEGYYPYTTGEFTVEDEDLVVEFTMEEIEKEGIYSNGYEDLVERWKTSVDGRFEPVIMTHADGTHYLSVDQNTRNNSGNNGSILTSNETVGALTEGAFTFTCRVKLGASNDQTATAFRIYDGTNPGADQYGADNGTGLILKLAEVEKYATTWTINDNPDNKVTVSAGGDKDLADLDWVYLQVTWKDGFVYLTVKDEEGNVIDGYDKQVLLSMSEAGGLGRMTFVTSRYNANFAIDDIVVREVEDDDLSEGEPAKYTLSYLFEGNVIKTETQANFVGETIEAKSPITIDGQKYYAEDGETTSMELKSGDNTLEVNLRKAYNYNYSLKSSLGETIVEGKGIEGETINAPYPRYVLTEDGFYESAKTNNEYRKPILLSEDEVFATVEYKKIDSINVVFYVEGEDIEGIDETVAGNIPVRASNAKAGVSSEDVLITTLPAGKYVFHAGVFTSRTSFNENSKIWFGIGGEPFGHTFVNGNLSEAKSEEFELTKETEIKYWGSDSWDQAQLDYFWIEEIKEIEPLDTCSAPTVAIGDFSFAKKGYEVTFAVAEGDTVSVLNISTDGKTFEKQTSPYVTVADSTTTYYVKAVAEGMAASAVIDTTVTVGYDNKKAYIAYVYDKSYSSGVVFAEEKIVKALQEDYNVVEVAWAADSIPSEDWANADLIISTEAMTGNKALSNGMKNFVGKAPMVALKAYNYNSGRWSWGTPANPSPAALGFTPKNGTYKVLEGVTAEEDGTIQVATETSSNAIQTVSFDGTDAPEDIVVMGTVGGEDAAAAMYASNAQKFFGLGLSSDCWKNYTDNPGIIIKNVAAILIAGGDLTEAEVADGISAVNTESETDAIYNLQGQKVQKVEKGLYIINGKKVVVK